MVSEGSVEIPYYERVIQAIIEFLIGSDALILKYRAKELNEKKAVNYLLFSFEIQDISHPFI